MWGDVGRCGKMWGDVGRKEEIFPLLAVPPAARRGRASKRDHAELDGAKGDKPAAPRSKPTKRKCRVKKKSGSKKENTAVRRA